MKRLTCVIFIICLLCQIPMCNGRFVKRNQKSLHISKRRLIRHVEEHSETQRLNTHAGTSRLAHSSRRFGDVDNQIYISADDTRVPTRRSHSRQKIRLRGGDVIGSGRVEIFHEGIWKLSCDDAWNKKAADVVCNNLGFHRESDDRPLLIKIRNISEKFDFFLTNIRCADEATTLSECTGDTVDTCSLRKIAGVRCLPNVGCESHEARIGRKCYSVYTNRMVQPLARAHCQRLGGNLATVDSQLESDFLADLLYFAAGRRKSPHWLAGIKMDSEWVWTMGDAETRRMFFRKWFPGFKPKGWNKQPDDLPDYDCLAAEREFSTYDSEMVEVDYYYWSNYPCRRARFRFVCERILPNVGCIRGNGKDYRGTANMTIGGQPCVSWNENEVVDFGRAFLNKGIGDHNYCRNPDEDKQPWCLISSIDFDYCDIPQCDDTDVNDNSVSTTTASNSDHDSLGVSSSNPPSPSDTVTTSRPTTPGFRCPQGKFHCGAPTEVCIPASWRCDYQADCENQADEQDCPNYLEAFSRTSSHTMTASPMAVYIYASEQQCAKFCTERADFVCRSFTHMPEDNRCKLSNLTKATSGKVMQATGSNYFEMKAYSNNCSELFLCDNGKCIDKAKKCDGSDDCGDSSDESGCSGVVPFEIRLAGGSGKHEGRVEVKHFGKWGVVCDDSWDIEDAEVVCQELGFEKGALEATTKSKFGAGNGEIFLDDVLCLGTESSLQECHHPGWKQHDCSTNEIAGVVCRSKHESCPARTFTCKNKQCVSLHYLCDDDDDCGDSSDEEHCKEKLEVRLVHGNSKMSGRVEVKYFEQWGTVCDDNFDDNAAKVVCRMLGYKGDARAFPGSKFGEGSGHIWIDDIACTGSEGNLDECGKADMGIHNCDHKEDAGVLCSNILASPTSGQHTTDNDADCCGDCGKRFITEPTVPPTDSSLISARIVSGTSTLYGAYPWQVGIRVSRYWGYSSIPWCGGTIIDEWWILTAAHCLEDYPKNRYLIRTGDWDNEEEDLYEQEFRIEDRFIHNEWHKGSEMSDDIALVRIQPDDSGRGIRFTTHVQAACLPKADEIYEPMKICSISGWGSTSNVYKYYPRILQAAQVPLMSQRICTHYLVYGRKVTDEMFCAGYLEGGVDSCQGDSGGPLVCEVEGVHKVMGVISWGTECARAGKPGVYTRVSLYVDWIKAKMRDYEMR